MVARECVWLRLDECDNCENPTKCKSEKSSRVKVVCGEYSCDTANIIAYTHTIAINPSWMVGEDNQTNIERQTKKKINTRIECDGKIE